VRGVGGIGDCGSVDAAKGAMKNTDKPPDVKDIQTVINHTRKIWERATKGLNAVNALPEDVQQEVRDKAVMRYKRLVSSLARQMDTLRSMQGRCYVEYSVLNLPRLSNSLEAMLLDLELVVAHIKRRDM